MGSLSKTFRDDITGTVIAVTVNIICTQEMMQRGKGKMSFIIKRALCKMEKRSNGHYSSFGNGT